MTIRATALVIMGTALGLTALAQAGPGESDRPHVAVDFNLDIRPILSKHCVSCHGLDEKARKAGLRLDNFDGATATADSGLRAVVPGKPDQSELIRRVTSSNPDERMPPVETGRNLSQTQIDLLRRWIEGGAVFESHWSFNRPTRRPAPKADRSGWSANAIDEFVFSRLEKEQLQPSKIAEPERLLRRVSMDLTGLPPTIEELDEYLDLAERDPEGAYTKAVDRLLASPHFGERMAIDWLDAARYADTNGYFSDKPRQIWLWRDWVIAASNANMPFDQFTIEQLAGDLLPDATRDQRIATGFHRNSMANNETGIIDEEYRVEAVVDRVETTATVWLGLTLGCAQCHDHKFDPISQREYYQFFAYFNNSVETGLITNDSPPPTIEVPTAQQVDERNRRQQSLVEHERRLADLSQTLDQEISKWQSTALEKLKPAVEEGIRLDFDTPNHTAQPIGTTIKREIGIRGDAGRFDGTQHLEIGDAFDANQPWTIALWFRPEGSLGCLLSKIEPSEQRRGIEILWKKGKLQFHLVHRWNIDQITAVTQQKLEQNRWHHLLVQYDGSRRGAGLRLTINGEHTPLSISVDELSGSLQCAEPLRIGRRDSGLGFYGLLDQIVVLQRLAPDDEASAWSTNERLRGVLERPTEKRSTGDLAFLKEYFVETLADPQIQSASEALKAAQQNLAELQRQIPKTLIMEDRKKPRTTHILARGQYDQPGIEVTASVPGVFPAVSENVPTNRLTLARWLVANEHPLTSRVAVNRLWQTCFGEGLVRTPNDFGSQGDPPTHPELLDHIAVTFVESGWNVKRMLRQIVTSSTYRQSSQPTPALLKRDPENRLMARGPRFRLPAEFVRDSALAASDLLSPRVGGPSVRPYQPDGLWEEVSYNGDESYTPNTDDGLWRRTLYTYWKRQAPPPAQLTFDAGTREKCLVRRSRTSTPLQALVMLNDPAWIEASRVMAQTTLTGSKDDVERLKNMYRNVISRFPDAHELQVLRELLDRQRARFRADPIAAQQTIRIGAAPLDPTIDAVELTAWTIVAQTILNLDEMVMRR